MSFLDVLVKKGAIKSSQISSVEKEVSASGKIVDDVLIELGVDSRDIRSAKEEYFNLPSKKIDDKDISLDIEY